MRRVRSVQFIFVAFLVGLMAFGGGLASADTTIVVTQAHSQGWEPFLRGGGEIHYVSDETSPNPVGALQLTTDDQNASGASYGHGASGPLSSVAEMSYWAYQAAGPALASAGFVLTVDLDGDGDDSTGFTNFIYEPYWQNEGNPDSSPVVSQTWQQWDVDAGLFWSTRTYTDGLSCNLTAGAGGPPFYTLDDLQLNCPSAIITGFGVNVGTYNPSYVINVDGVNFNGTVYDFELANEPASKDDCKNSGWDTLTRADGSAFLNQGECVSYVVSGS